MLYIIKTTYDNKTSYTVSDDPPTCSNQTIAGFVMDDVDEDEFIREIAKAHIYEASRAVTNIADKLVTTVERAADELNRVTHALKSVR